MSIVAQNTTSVSSPRCPCPKVMLAWAAPGRGCVAGPGSSLLLAASPAWSGRIQRGFLGGAPPGIQPGFTDGSVPG